jgi:hypothetical protein
MARFVFRAHFTSHSQRAVRYHVLAAPELMADACAQSLFTAQARPSVFRIELPPLIRATLLLVCDFPGWRLLTTGEMGSQQTSPSTIYARRQHRVCNFELRLVFRLATHTALPKDSVAADGGKFRLAIEPFGRDRLN